MLPLIKIGSVEIYTFPIIILLAIYVSALYLIKSARYSLERLKELFKLLLLSLPLVFLCGKLLFFLGKWKAGEIIQTTDLLFGGIVFYGGLIGGIISFLLYCKIRNRNIFEYTDIVSSVLPLAQAIGRIGCFLNGCCYGILYDGFFSVQYPLNSEIVRVFPVWFLECLLCVLLFGILQQKKCYETKGWMTCFYVVGYSFIRFIVEFFRGDTIRGAWGYLSTSQIISVIFIVLGIVILFILKTIKNKKKDISKGCL